MRKAIISDLDNTLALLNGRNPEDEQHKLMDDLINEPLKRVITFFLSEGYPLLVLTGRWEEFYDQTLEWLKRNDIVPDKLYMRPATNYATGTRLKEWYLENVIQNTYDVEVAFEDTYVTAKMYRAHGINAWLVNGESWDKEAD